MVQVTMGIRAAPGRGSSNTDKVATLTAVVLVMVIAIEQLSLWIRSRLR
jgi:ABC-type phosphate/phosphonate transport system permease subunit